MITDLIIINPSHSIPPLHDIYIYINNEQLKYKYPANSNILLDYIT